MVIWRGRGQFPLGVVRLGVLVLTLVSCQLRGQAAIRPDRDEPVSVAVLPFDTQGDKQSQQLVSQLLTAELSISPDWLLVEREELDQVFEEMKLNLSGLVKQSDAIRIGQLTGARVLITGSMLDVGTKRYLIAKLISTETSRVLGVSVKGKTDKENDRLVEQLASEIRSTLVERVDSILPEVLDRDVRISQIAKLLKKNGWKKKKLPSVSIDVSEEHVGSRPKDPAVLSEIEYVLTQLGFTVLTDKKKGDAEYQILGEGLSEFSGRHKDLLYAKARVELKLVRESKVVVSGRQTAMAIGLNEQIAGKEALQRAAATLMERLLTQLPKN